MIRFEPAGVNKAGEKIYTMTIDGKTIQEGLTIDQAVAIINKHRGDHQQARRGPARLGTRSWEGPRWGVSSSFTTRATRAHAADSR